MYNIKKQLGFNFGPIVIFKGDTYTHKEWLKSKGAKYRKYCGWYFPSGVTLPTDFPDGITPIRLYWELIAKDDEVLLPDHIIKEHIENLIYDETKSTFVGAIGERITAEIKLKQKQVVSGPYGYSYLYTMEDKNENVYIWFSSSLRELEENQSYKITGTIKDHKKFRGVKQTVLTRCRIGG